MRELNKVMRAEMRRTPLSRGSKSNVSPFWLIRFFNTVFDMINAIYRDKLLPFIGATFQEKLIYHHKTLNINC